MCFHTCPKLVFSLFEALILKREEKFYFSSYNLLIWSKLWLTHNYKIPTHRFDSVHNGHHDVASVVSLEIEEVDWADSPKIDAWQPWQDRELETLWQVGPFCVERQISYLQRHTTNGKLHLNLQSCISYQKTPDIAIWTPKLTKNFRLWKVHTCIPTPPLPTQTYHNLTGPDVFLGLKSVNSSRIFVHLCGQDWEMMWNPALNLLETWLILPVQEYSNIKFQDYQLTSNL